MCACRGYYVALLLASLAALSLTGWRRPVSLPPTPSVGPRLTSGVLQTLNCIVHDRSAARALFPRRDMACLRFLPSACMHDSPELSPSLHRSAKRVATRVRPESRCSLASQRLFFSLLRLEACSLPKNVGHLVDTAAVLTGNGRRGGGGA